MDAMTGKGRAGPREESGGRWPFPAAGSRRRAGGARTPAGASAASGRLREPTAWRTLTQPGRARQIAAGSPRLGAAGIRGAPEPRHPRPRAGV